MHGNFLSGGRAGAPAASLLVALMLAVIGLAPPAAAQTTVEQSAKIWGELKGDVFGDREILTGTGLVALEAPKRAQDAALVPIDIRLDSAKAGGRFKSLTLIIDVNPSPVAARFDFGGDAGVTHLSTRVRIDDYSYVRAIAETENGELHMVETFVKASGGCSAPAVKKHDAATLGEMKLRQFPPNAEPAMTKVQELQLMIRHPNRSGLQRDPLTQYFIPPHFVHKLSIAQDGRPILAMEGGISISEDPNFRFDFVAHGAGEIVAEATDTEGKVFRDRWPLEAAGL